MPLLHSLLMESEQVKMVDFQQWRGFRNFEGGRISWDGSSMRVGGGANSEVWGTFPQKLKAFRNLCAKFR